LGQLRIRIETKAKGMKPPQPIVAVISRVSEDLVDIPAARAGGRDAEIRVQVVEKSITAKDIVSLRFQSIKEQLPTFQPGAHIDVHLQNGLVRQYSLINGPGETDHYTIGVKREPDSLTVQFDITDNTEIMTVEYTGILPDLFREGQGIVAMGNLQGSGRFVAQEVLAKHDENYMPPEVADALKASEQAAKEKSGKI
jgi:hypothetical protein